MYMQMRGILIFIFVYMVDPNSEYAFQRF